MDFLKFDIFNCITFVDKKLDNILKRAFITYRLFDPPEVFNIVRFSSITVDLHASQNCLGSKTGWFQKTKKPKKI
jgi:hypothetical protein